MAAPHPSEKEVVAALEDALAPVPVWWGYGPQELAEGPPSLPLVIVVRTAAVVRTDWDDMCDLPEDQPLAADVTLQVRIWHTVYEQARDLQRDARAALRTLGGWSEQNEFDTRDGDLRAWCITSDWLSVAIALD